jgi:hypothetical protein
MPTASLTDILQHHLSYEISMLLATYLRLEQPQKDDVIKNALIEAFCVHARLLVEFVSNQQGVRAREFTDSQHAPGTNIRPELITKLNTQIAHITFKRTEIEVEKIGPNERFELLVGVLTSLQTFARHLRPEFTATWNSMPWVTFIAPSRFSPQQGATPSTSNHITTQSLTITP